MARVPSQAVFVGRQAERDRLAAALHAAIAGRPQVLLLEGDAGIGKTRLAREAESQAEALGMQTVFGRFIEDGQTPFLAFASAFVPQCDRARLLDEGSPLGPLAAHLRRIAGLPAGEGGQSDAGPGLALALGRAALLLAQRRPMFLVLDDIHWAEQAAVDLFADLVRAVADAAEREPVRICILAVMRPPAPDGHLQRVLERLRREPIVARMALGGLDELEVNELIASQQGAACAPPLLGALQRATQGNPLFVLELVEHLEASGALVRDFGRLVSRVDPEVLPLPREVTRAIAERVAVLPGEVRQVLTTAAIAADEFSPAYFAIVTGLGEREAMDAIDAGVAANFLVDTGASYRFAHPVVRHVLQDSATSGRRRQVHAEIAGRLRSRLPLEPHLIEIAGHVAASQAPVTGELHALVLRAARSAASGAAYGRAALLFDAVLANPGSLDAAAAIDVTTEAALAHYRDLDITGADRLYERVVELATAARAGDAWARALEGQLRIWLAHGAARPWESLERRYREFGSAELSVSKHLHARLLATWADCQRRTPTGTALAEEAFSVAQGTDAQTEARAAFTLAMVREKDLNIGEARDLFALSAELAAVSDDTWYVGWGIQNGPVPLLTAFDLAGAAEAADVAVRASFEIGDWAVRANGRTWEGAVQLARGDFDAASRLFRMVPGLSERSDYPHATTVAMFLVAALQALQGQVQPAEDLIAQLEARAGASAVRYFRAWTDALLRPGGLPMEHELLSARAFEQGLSDQTAPVFAMLADIADLASYRELAARTQPFLSAAIERGYRYVITAGLFLPRLEASCAALTGDSARALAGFERAAAEAEAQGAKVELARTCIAWGRALASSDRNRALALIERGRADAAGIGMWAVVDQAQAAARRLGLVVGPRASVYPSGISETQVALLGHLAAGEPIDRAAEALLLSPAAAQRLLDSLPHPFTGTTAAEAEAALAAIGVLAANDSELVVPERQRRAVLFADLVDSTGHNRTMGDDEWAISTTQRERIWSRLVLQAHGNVVKTMGDGLFAVFEHPGDAVAAAAAIQADRSLAPGAVRTGVHFGEPRRVQRSNAVDFFGLDVTLAARICARAGGGEVLVSAAVREALPEPWQVEDRGLVVLKSFPEGVRLFRVAPGPRV